MNIQENIHEAITGSWNSSEFESLVESLQACGIYSVEDLYKGGSLTKITYGVARSLRESESELYDILLAAADIFACKLIRWSYEELMDRFGLESLADTRGYVTTMGYLLFPLLDARLLTGDNVKDEDARVTVFLVAFTREAMMNFDD